MCLHKPTKTLQRQQNLSSLDQTSSPADTGGIGDGGREGGRGGPQVDGEVWDCVFWWNTGLY